MSEPIKSERPIVTIQEGIDLFTKLQANFTLNQKTGQTYKTALKALGELSDQGLESNLTTINFEECKDRLSNQKKVRGDTCERYKNDAERARKYVLAYFENGKVPTMRKVVKLPTVGKKPKQELTEKAEQMPAPPSQKREFIFPVNGEIEVVIRTTGTEIRIKGDDIGRLTNWLEAFKE